MAMLWNLSQQQILDQNGSPMVGAKAYFFLGGTTTPITTYAAYALGSVNANPNPVVSDGFGRWPSVFFDEANNFYRVRVASAGGVTVFDVDGLPIIGPSGGGGGGGDSPVNPDAVFKTGDVKHRYDEDFQSGWVRWNGRTIGSATSGATERANADTQALFEYLWNKDSNLVVVGGRGATSSADWSANKQITLPDGRGKALVGLDDMGNTAAGILSSATTLGWVGGEQAHTLTTTEMPNHRHAGTTDQAGNHQHGNQFGPDTAGGAAGSGVFTLNGTSSTGFAGNHVHTFLTDLQGGGAAHNNVQPSLAVTIYQKL